MSLWAILNILGTTMVTVRGVQDWRKANITPWGAGVGLFSQIPSDRENGLKLCQGRSSWKLEEISSQKEQSGIGTVCPGRQ